MLPNPISLLYSDLSDHINEVLPKVQEVFGENLTISDLMYNIILATPSLSLEIGYWEDVSIKRSLEMGYAPQKYGFENQADNFFETVNYILAFQFHLKESL